MSQDSKSASSREAELAQLLKATGGAHHEAFIETDGFDPDWAIWYAEHAQDQVNSLLGADLSRAEIVYELVGLSREQPTNDPDTPWPDFYASSLIDRLGEPPQT